MRSIYLIIDANIETGVEFTKLFADAVTAAAAAAAAIIFERY